MTGWWHSLELVIAFNTWMQVLVMLGVAMTAVGILLLWVHGSRMTGFLLEREQRASRKIRAVEKAAEEIRKELLATQQNQDIADQRRRLAEMDAEALRKEVEKTRKRYSEAEGALKERIEELKGIHITQTQGGEMNRTADLQPSNPGLDAHQRSMLIKLLGSGPKGELRIISDLEDPKSHEVALDLKKIFEEQGWSTSEIIRSAFANPPEGFLLIIHSKETAPSYSKFLQRTFTTMGLAVSAQINNKYPEWSISLVIGHLD